MIDITNYQKGILWGISTINNDNRIVVRHKNRYFIDALGIDNSVYEQNGHTDIQYVLKFRDKNILNELIKNGYAARNSDERCIPHDADIEFIQAWIELHGSCDWQKTKRGRKVRLRIYGNKLLISQLNQLMSQLLDVSEKTPQKITDKTYMLSFGSQDEIDHICSRFETETIRCDEFWDKLRAMIIEYNNR